MDVNSKKKSPRQKWDDENTERICLKINKAFCAKQRLKDAAKAAKMTPTAYAMAAIEDALQRDGLPRPAADVTHDMQDD